MRFGILSTNNGKHSDEKLAVATAGEIIQVAADSQSEDAMEARSLETKIIEILLAHHTKVSQHEVSHLEADPAHLSAGVDPREHSADTVDDVLAECDASRFASWFAQPSVRASVDQVIHSWTATNMHMHHSWYCDGKTGHHKDLKPAPGHSPDNEYVKAYLHRKNNGGPGTGYGGLPDALAKEAVAH